MWHWRITTASAHPLSAASSLSFCRIWPLFSSQVHTDSKSRLCGSCGPAHDEVEGFVSSLVTAGVVPLSCGGDHSLLLPLLRAVRSGQRDPLSLIHIDAHTDTWDDLWGEPDHHGSPVRWDPTKFTLLLNYTNL